MCEPLRERALRKRTLSAAGSRARTSVTKAEEPASPKELARVCGASLPGSFAFYDQDSSSWKTWQRSLLGGLTVFSGTWPLSGLMRNGRCFQRQPLVRRTKGKGCFLLPTPVKALGGAAASLTDSMVFRETTSGVPRKVSGQGVDGSVGLVRLLLLWTAKYPRATFVEWMMGFPRNWTALDQSATP